MQRRNCARQMGQKQRQIYRHARLPNAIYICNTSGQTYSLVTILEVDE